MGIGSLVCIINLPIAPNDNISMKLGCMDKGIEDLIGSDFFSNLETFIVKAILAPGNSFLF